ncbi:MAG TPA: heavy metal translocating P-type ATPase [Thioploca sp.]|nr:heavy metal translocating P-type ATPase [Thioploca sp.]
MLPLGFLFVGSIGVTSVGIKACQKLTENQDTPSPSNPHKKTTIGKVKSEKTNSLSTDLRHQQMADISSSTTDNDEIREFDQETNYYLSISSVGLGLATAGSLVFPPLSLLSVPVSMYVSLPIFHDVYRGIVQERKLKVSVIDSIGIIGGLFSGYYFVTALATFVYYSAAKLLIKTRNTTRKTLINVFTEQPRSVWLLKDGTELEIPLHELCVGDIIVVNAGEIIAADGIIAEGMATIDQHALTGEAQPYEKGVGEQVLAASIVLAGQIYIQVEKTGTETIAAQIGEIINHTANFELSLQTRGEKVAEKTVLPTLAAGTLALVTLGRYSSVAVFSANFAEVIKVINPIGMLNFLNLASQDGILIKDGRSLELLNQIDTVVFDKTGTLTQEQPHLGNIYTCNGVKENDLLTYAAAAEYKQNHPIARAIVQGANERTLNLPEIDDSQYEIGYGIKVKITDQLIRVGSIRFMEMEGIAIPGEIHKLQHSSHEQGYSTVYVAIDQQLGGMLELQPTIRPEAKHIIRQLRQRNLSIYIISGDHEHPTKQLAEELGIDHYFANTLPQDKANKIEQMQTEGKSVCFVGDGINDSIALKKANVSISLRGASTAATDTAQVILMDQTLTKLEQFFELAQYFDKNQKTGLATTLVPGVLCVGGIFFLHFGILSSMMFYNVSAIAGIGNALSPLLKKAPEKVVAPTN